MTAWCAHCDVMRCCSIQEEHKRTWGFVSLFPEMRKSHSVALIAVDTVFAFCCGLLLLLCLLNSNSIQGFIWILKNWTIQILGMQIIGNKLFDLNMCAFQGTLYWFTDVRSCVYIILYFPKTLLTLCRDDFFLDLWMHFVCMSAVNSLYNS